MRRLVSILVVIGMFGVEAGYAETILRRIQLNEGSPRSTVVGMETGSGVILGVGSLDKKRTGLKGTVRVRDLQEKDNLILRNGAVLETDAIDYVYVEERLSQMSELGKHPNIDDNTSGGN
jgi:hypothetical protein